MTQLSEGHTAGQAWIETFSGRRFPLLAPRPEDVCIEDIAHALSMQCRFTGHTRIFYSTAEHSLRVSHLCDAPGWGLLHDASEAYIQDLSRPLKYCTPVGEPYRAIEARIMEAICERFGLCGEIPESVHRADAVMLLTEKRDLMGGLEWSPESIATWKAQGISPHPTVLLPMKQRVAKIMFLHRFRQLFPSYV